MDKFTYVDTEGNKKEFVIQNPLHFFVMPYIDLLKINLQL